MVSDVVSIAARTANVAAPVRSGWRNPSPAAVRAIKIAVFALALIPLARLGLFAWLGKLTANPIEFITRSTGTWTLSFVLITLTVTPLRRMLDWPWLLRLRRMLGLFAFFYATLHLLTYLWFDRMFSVSAMLSDVPRRPFIAVGLAAFGSLVPLAATSTAGMIRRLGGRRWRALHRLAYAAAVLGVVHYWWLVKADTTSPRRYAVLLAGLLAARVIVALRRGGPFVRQRP